MPGVDAVADPALAAVEGTLARIVFAAADGSFVVARLDSKEDGPVTVVGPLAGVPVGARLRLRGKREENAKFGQQFRVSFFVELAPKQLTASGSIWARG